MIGEAAAHGLTVNTQAVNQLAWGIQRQGSARFHARSAPITDQGLASVGMVAEVGRIQRMDEIALLLWQLHSQRRAKVCARGRFGSRVRFTAHGGRPALPTCQHAAATPRSSNICIITRLRRGVPRLPLYPLS